MHRRNTIIALTVVAILLLFRSGWAAPAALMDTRTEKAKAAAVAASAYDDATAAEAVAQAAMTNALVNAVTLLNENAPKAQRDAALADVAAKKAALDAARTAREAARAAKDKGKPQ